MTESDEILRDAPRNVLPPAHRALVLLSPLLTMCVMSAVSFGVSARYELAFVAMAGPTAWIGFLWGHTGRFVRRVEHDKRGLLVHQLGGKPLFVAWPSVGYVRLHMTDSIAPIMVFHIETDGREERLTLPVNSRVGLRADFPAILLNLAESAPEKVVVRGRRCTRAAVINCLAWFLASGAVGFLAALATGPVYWESAAAVAVVGAAFILITANRGVKGPITVDSDIPTAFPVPKAFRDWVRALSERLPSGAVKKNAVERIR